MLRYKGYINYWDKREKKHKAYQFNNLSAKETLAIVNKYKEDEDKRYEGQKIVKDDVSVQSL